MVQLKCNLMPTHGSAGVKAWVNLQMGAGEGAGVCSVHQQPSMNLWCQF